MISFRGVFSNPPVEHFHRDESARTEYDESEPTIKRRKLTEYPAVLEKLHDEYIPYRNTVLQKWHDRTRIASGRLAKTDFSAFDVPITKQLEEALVDKRRLIERTHVKRTDYKLIGDEEPNEVNQDNEVSVLSFHFFFLKSKV